VRAAAWQSSREPHRLAASSRARVEAGFSAEAAQGNRFVEGQPRNLFGHKVPGGDLAQLGSAEGWSMRDSRRAGTCQSQDVGVRRGAEAAVERRWRHDLVQEERHHADLIVDVSA
jgi:hypothetical protein